MSREMWDWQLEYMPYRPNNKNDWNAPPKEITQPSKIIIWIVK